MSKANVLTRSKKAKAEALLNQNRLDAALELCDQICRANRNDPEAWTLLAVIRRRLGRHTEAEQAARRAVELRPGFAPARQALGTALHCQQRLPEAIECYRAAIALAPDEANLHYLLGNALRETGALLEADASYARAVELRPLFLEALSNRGATLMALSRNDEARLCLNRANELQPNVPQVVCNIAQLLQMEGHFNEAKGYCRQALQRDPNFIDAIAILAELEEKSHATPELQSLLTRGLALAPDNIQLNLVAARLARQEGRLDDAIARLETLREKQPEPLQGDILILLGQLYDKRKDTERAFHYLSEGNRLKAACVLPGADDSDHYLRRIEEQRARFRAETPESWQPFADDGCTDHPVFLLGFPRSGTTLLEQILDSHPQLQALEEKPTVGAMEDAFLKLSAGRAQPYAELTPEEAQRLRKIYFDTVARHIKREPGRILIDKMPLNTVQIPLIWRVFPKARFILAIRHPCDACFSCFMQNFALNHAMATFFSLQKTAEAYAGVMSLWREYAERLPIDYHLIRYEDLVMDKAGETGRLLEFLGLEWHDNVLRHDEHARTRGITTPSYHQVTQPIYRDARFRWQRYAQQLAPILPLLQPYIEHFGYAQPDKSGDTAD